MYTEKREGEEIMKLKPDSIIIRTYGYIQFNNFLNMVKKIIEQDEVFVVAYGFYSLAYIFLDYNYTSSGIYHF